MILKTHVGDCLPWLRAMPSNHVDFVLTSPPYEDARTYEDGAESKFKMAGQRWVDWLAEIVNECCRVSRGFVAVNMSSRVRDRRYTCAVEWLVADLTRLWPVVCGPSPYAWVKSAGIPGSGGPQYHRRDWEPIYVFAKEGKLPTPFADPLAFGQPCKYTEGGEFSARTKSGKRANGSKKQNGYKNPPIANPGNVIRTNNGGGHVGDAFAESTEAPMNLEVAERFVCWYAPRGGLVLDPFCGSGTTGFAALKHGRRAILCDVRENQIELTRRRLATVSLG